MALKSNIEWAFWGEHDPLWAVAAWNERAKDGQNPWTPEEFYELGRSDWRDFIEHWRRYGVDTRVGVEIGCGAGRLTRHMADYFTELHALDVSPAMITYAKKHVHGPNVHFQVVSGDEIPVSASSVTAVFSTHVFQHFDTLDDGTAYFREIARVLQPGGTLMIHLPVYSWPRGAGRWVRRVFRLNKMWEEIQAARKRDAIQKGQAAGFMRMNSYPMDYFYRVLPKLGFRDIELSVFVTKSNDDPHACVLATKRGSLVLVEPAQGTH